MTDILNAYITPEIANNVLNYFISDEGFNGGYFATKLYDLMAHADRSNLTKIAEGFPAQVAAFELARTTHTGFTSLRIIASADNEA